MAARLRVRVQPKASSNGITGWQDGVLRVRLTAPPVDGAANQALVEFIAETLGLRRAEVTLVAGHRGRLKTLEVSLSEDDLAARLAENGRAK